MELDEFIVFAEFRLLKFVLLPNSTCKSIHTRRTCQVIIIKTTIASCLKTNHGRSQDFLNRGVTLSHTEGTHYEFCRLFAYKKAYKGGGGGGVTGTPGPLSTSLRTIAIFYTQALFLKEYSFCNCGLNILIFFRFYAEYILMNIHKLSLHQRKFVRIRDESGTF